MSKLRGLFVVAFLLALPELLRAELPLPDATFFGQLTAPGGAPVLNVSGAFLAAEGAVVGSSSTSRYGGPSCAFGCQ
jgi:hypothetical protein